MLKVKTLNLPKAVIGSLKVAILANFALFGLHLSKHRIMQKAKMMETCTDSEMKFSKKLPNEVAIAM